MREIISKKSKKKFFKLKFLKIIQPKLVKEIIIYPNIYYLVGNCFGHYIDLNINWNDYSRYFDNHHYF